MPFLGQARDGPRLPARRRGVGNDGQNLERQALRREQLGRDGLAADDHERLGRSGCRQLDRLAQAARPVSVEADDRVGDRQGAYESGRA
jgi:hypothetical protein